jgi:hypothetical protein
MCLRGRHVCAKVVDKPLQELYVNGSLLGGILLVDVSTEEKVGDPLDGTELRLDVASIQQIYGDLFNFPLTGQLPSG